MRKHNGMRPQDIVILLKISILNNSSWMVMELAMNLYMSQSEVSESLNRSKIAKLISEDKKHLIKSNFLDFLKYGFKYVFPVIPGGIVRGIPTGHSAPPLNALIKSNEQFVWPWINGDQRGQEIHPLHPSVPKACLLDSSFHQLLSLADALRIGNVREQNLAIENLEARL